MGLFRPLAIASPNDERVWDPPRYSLRSKAGVPINAQSILGISAVWACTRLISQSLASIPLLMYERQTDGGRRRASGHPLYDLLHDQPNVSMTAFEFKRLLTMHALLRGNGYARILPGPRGLVDHLVPLHPDIVTPEPVPTDDERLRYRIKRSGQPDEVLTDDEVFHLVGLSWDGRVGVSVIEYARETMGLALATESHGARLFGQGISLAGVVEVPRETKITQQGAQNLRMDLETQHAGLGNAHSVMVLADGATWKPMGLTSEDSQFLETRQFQVAEVARWFGVDLTLIQENTKATSWGTGIEQLLQAFVTFTLLPWAVLWEQAISRDMVVAPQRYFPEYQLNSLVRGDLLARYQAYDLAVKGGWKSRNEVRRLENDNPVPGLDDYDRPLNVASIGQPEPVVAQPQGRREAHYSQLLREAAGRVVRKEQAALERASRHCKQDSADWAQAVDEFYADHASYVAAALAIPAATAELYVTGQKLTLLERGPGAVEDWLPARIEHLVQLAEAN